MRAVNGDVVSCTAFGKLLTKYLIIKRQTEISVENTEAFGKFPNASLAFYNMIFVYRRITTVDA